MDQYLFLFPIEKYIEAAIGSYSRFRAFGCSPKELYDLVNARYRNPEYRIAWLVFSKQDNKSEPDLSDVPLYMRIQSCDDILVAGVSYEDHITKKIFPNPKFVLEQLPKHSRLVLGGFHVCSCVDKIAEASYKSGTDTFVDEDTTELFFRYQAKGMIPKIREKWSLENYDLGSQYECAIELRKNKPWLVQE